MEMTSQSIEVISEPLEQESDVPSAAEEKKLKKLEQLRAARESKKIKKAAKAKEDAEVREALLRLKEENEQLKKRKREEESPSAPPTTTVDEEEEPEEEKVEEEERPAKRSKPVRVTRDDKVDDEKDAQSTGRSFAQQAAVTAVVGGLGLASWYCQNRLFQPTAPPPVQPKPKPKPTPKPMLQPKVQGMSQTKPTRTKREAPQPGMLFTNRKKTKKIVGSSGFTM
jgi:hypothetical protein